MMLYSMAVHFMEVLIMANFCILRWSKLHTNGEIGASLDHMMRLRPTDNAAPT